MSRGEGFAYVEVGLRLPGDGRASVFRGVDRRGSAQTSLREAGGQRVTAGAESVERRLGENAQTEFRLVAVDLLDVQCAHEGQDLP